VNEVGMITINRMLYVELLGSCYAFGNGLLK